MITSVKNNTETVHTTNEASLWVEKYRPRTLSDVIIPTRVRKLIQNAIDNGIARHILLYGDTGTGKTTIARILAKRYDTLKINASKENGIDTVRDVITPFVNVAGFGRPKLVFLDEIDNFSKDASLSFRGLIEDSSKTARYVATCNYIERMEKAILSRFGNKISFQFSGDELKEVFLQKIARIRAICEKEGMTIQDDAIKTLIVKYNDLRDIIENLQTMHELGITEIKESDIESFMTKQYTKLFEFVSKKQDIYKIRSFITSNHPNQYYNIIVAMGDAFCMWLKETNNPMQKNAGVFYVLANKSKVSSKGQPDQLTCVMSLMAEFQHYIK